MITPGRRGLGFGVGTEPLPAVFAKLGVQVMATDAPSEIAHAAGWQKTEEFAASLNDLYKPEIIGRERFDAQVAFRTCDMTAIAPEFSGYDFCWSSCCLEHLGSLRAGLDFIRDSVEKVLRVGGVACHTTEFNLSSDERTVEDGGCVLYRRRDIEAFIVEMRERGHHVADLRIAPDTHAADWYVDVPPYRQDPHLKLELLGYTTTSAGLVITRGR